MTLIVLIFKQIYDLVWGKSFIFIFRSEFEKEMEKVREEDRLRREEEAQLGENLAQAEMETGFFWI